MALLAEELVEEWLNREGYFTIRGIRLGVNEMDLLAVKPTPSGVECRHIEVQASMRPKAYISKLSREVQRATGRTANSARVRDRTELRDCVDLWVAKKYDLPKKVALRNRLGPGPWSRELVAHVVKDEYELELIREQGVVVHRLVDVVTRLRSDCLACEGAAGAHLVDLVSIATSLELVGGATKR